LAGSSFAGTNGAGAALGVGLRLHGVSMPRIVYGALAGVAATAGMTAAMGRLDRLLPEPDRYPLPPREIVDRAGLAPDRDGRGGAVREADGRGAAAAMLAHFAYGAATGMAFAAQGRRSAASGALYGVAVWAASYLGWIPAARILRPAFRHPPARNALMLGVHALWGALLSLSLREIEAAERGPFRRRGRPLRDAPARLDRRG
jgi:hypothetical protein